jgi:hypothetical protein
MNRRLRAELEEGARLVSVSVVLVARSAAGDLDVPILA